jgi:hypothetical protein
MFNVQCVVNEGSNVYAYVHFVFPTTFMLRVTFFSRRRVRRGLGLEFQNLAPPRAQELRYVVIVLYCG